jgi:hypothetical protein
MVIRCVSQFSSSSGSFMPGDLVPDAVAGQVCRESPESFEVVNDDIPFVVIDALDKSVKRVQVRRKSTGDS